MKSGYSVSTIVLTFLAALFIWPAGCAAQQSSVGPKPGNGKVKWFVQLYRKNPKFIEVTVDRTKVSDNSIVEEVHFEVNFYDSNGAFLRKESFYFTDETLPYLKPGKHRRWFSPSGGEAGQAKGIELFYTVSPLGTNPTNPHRFKESTSHPEVGNEKDGVQEHQPPEQ